MGYQGRPGWYTVGELALELNDLLREQPDARGWVVEMEMCDRNTQLDRVDRVPAARPEMAANGYLVLRDKES